MVAPLIVLLAPFMQIGASYYASVATASFVIGLALRRGFQGAKLSTLALCLIVAFCMTARPLFYLGSDTGDILRSAREGVCFLVIATTLASRQSLSSLAVKRTLLSLQWVSIAMVVLVSVQSFYLLRKLYLGIPRELYAMNAATIPGDLDLLYSWIRPAGTFGEPSYLAFFCVSMVFAIFPVCRHYWSARIIVLCLAVTTYLSMSMLGILAMSGVLSLVMLQLGKKVMVLALWLFPFLVVTLVVYMADSLIADRLFSILGGQDASTNSRIVRPVLEIPDQIFNHPFGVPLRLLRDSGLIGNLYINVADVVHNGMLNIIFSYGVLGLIALATLLASARGTMLKLWVLVAMMQNGDFLSIDKTSMVIITVLLANGTRELTRYHGK